ncbi:MAG: pyruvate kinase alpha/beta domain-containing protein [Candidatus Zixiibacteriota bacterium]
MKSYDGTGPEFTGDTVKAAVAGCREHGIRYLVVASTIGKTAKVARDAVAGEDIQLVVVTHNTGFGEEGRQSFPDEARAELEAAGARVLTGTMVFRSLGRAIKDKTGGDQETLVASALRVLGEGTKVVAEIAMMAADAGLVPPEDVMCVAGTGRGADTAAVVRAVPSNRFFDLKIRAYVAKPYAF